MSLILWFRATRSLRPLVISGSASPDAAEDLDIADACTPESARRALDDGRAGIRGRGSFGSAGGVRALIRPRFSSHAGKCFLLGGREHPWIAKMEIFDAHR